MLARNRWISIPLFVSSLTMLSLVTPAGSQEQHSPIPWQKGPITADLGGRADLALPEGYLFTGKPGTAKLLELTHNLVSGAELGAITPVGEGEEDSWFVVFEFSDIGYVKDDDKNKIDAAALMKSIQEGTREANKERRKRGWQTFTVTGWERPPYYDSNTHNLTWAIRGVSDSGNVSVNHSVRILGRNGTMNVDLVMSPEQYASVVPKFESVMSGFQFKTGNRYADFVRGDKVAAYGLTALVVGGAGALAVKTGLLAKSWKLIVGLLLALKKLILVLILAIGAFFKRLLAWIRGLFAPKDETVSNPTDSSSSPGS